MWFSAQLVYRDVFDEFCNLCVNKPIVLTRQYVSFPRPCWEQRAEWLSSFLAEQEDRGSIPGLAT